MAAGFLSVACFSIAAVECGIITHVNNDGKASLNETPSGSRVKIAFFGLRNAGKSTLVNAFCGQDVAIVSDVPGTTTDPVSKAMEILPLGPCVVTDTAGLDDVGALGAERVRRTLSVLATADIAVWVEAEPADEEGSRLRAGFMEECRRRSVPVIEYRRGDSVEALREKVAAVKVEPEPAVLDGLVGPGDRVICVCPIDESAPKGRLILPQVQVLRDCLDRRATCTVCQPGDLQACLAERSPGVSRPVLVITDSQAFAEVRSAVDSFRSSLPPGAPGVRLTSFSVLFARQKGDLAAYVRGLGAISSLKDGDVVLVAEGCTHRRQCNDIGTVKIPKALRKISGRELSFSFSSGGTFAVPEGGAKPALVVHCGGCMLTRREVRRRIALAEEAGVPIVNYGLLLAVASGLGIDEVMP